MNHGGTYKLGSSRDFLCCSATSNVISLIFFNLVSARDVPVRDGTLEPGVSG